MIRIDIEDYGMTAVYEGGPYINLEDAEGQDVAAINVFDYEKGAARIPNTEKAVMKEVNAYLAD